MSIAVFVSGHYVELKELTMEEYNEVLKSMPATVSEGEKTLRIVTQAITKVRKCTPPSKEFIEELTKKFEAENEEDADPDALSVERASNIPEFQRQYVEHLEQNCLGSNVPKTTFVRSLSVASFRLLETAYNKVNDITEEEMVAFFLTLGQKMD